MRGPSLAPGRAARLAHGLGSRLAPSLLFATTLQLSACSSDTPEPATVVTRDSAGIEIVENGTADASGVASLRLGDRPRAIIGLDAGLRGHLLNQVVGAFRLAEGGIVLGDRGSREVRFFTDDGRHLRSVGGEGEGPGELRLLVGLDRMPGDTVVAAAFPLGLRVWWDSTGEYLAQTTSGRWGYGLVGGRTLPDGTFLIDVYEGSASYGNSIELWAATGEEGTTFRTQGVLVRVSREGEPTDTIDAVLGEEWFKIGTVRTPGFANHVRPFTSRTHLAFNDAHVFLGENHLGQVRAYAYDGTLARIVRWEPEHTPVTSGDRRRFRQQVLDRLNDPSRRPAFERWLSEVAWPELKPAFRTFSVDRTGRLWVQTWTTDDETDRWLIFDRSGALVASVVAPGSLRVLDAGEEWVLVLDTDELGAETVRLFDLFADETTEPVALRSSTRQP